MYYHQLQIGQIYTSRSSYYLSEQDLIEFSQKWDPHPFHIDKHAAQQHQVGKLFACALHTMSIATLLSHDTQYMEIDFVAGLGVDQLKMIKPVFAGETLSLAIEIIDKRLSKSQPNQGIITNKMSITNQDNDLKMTYICSAMVNVIDEI